MIKLITHSDLDGVSCYIVLQNYYATGFDYKTENIDVSFCEYSNVDRTALEAIYNHHLYDEIFITDISVNLEVASKISEVNSSYPDKIKLFDHHATALHLNKYNWATVNVEMQSYKNCGTELLYKYLLDNNLKPKLFTQENLTDYVEKVRRYDTWEWKGLYDDYEAKNLNTLFHIYGRDKFIREVFIKLTRNKKDFVLIDTMEEFILSLEQDKLNRYVDKKNESLIKKELKLTNTNSTNVIYTYGVVFADSYISELGNRLCDLNKELDFVAIINQDKVSLRSIKNHIDLSKIAKAFGGGGHRSASGFSIDDRVVNNFIDNAMKIFY